MSFHNPFRTCFSILATILISAGTPLVAQRGVLDRLLGNANDLVLQANDSFLVVVRVEYVLTDREGSEYGTRETDYYGFDNQLGVVTNDGILIPAQALKPWERDLDYQPVDTLKPKLYKWYVRRNQQRTFEELPAVNADSLNNQLALLRFTSQLPAAQISTVAEPGEAWFFAFLPGKIRTDTSAYRVDVSRQNLVRRVGGEPYYTMPNLNLPPDALGCAAFTCRVNAGLIQFELLGLCDINGGKTVLYPLAGPGLSGEVKKIPKKYERTSEEKPVQNTPPIDNSLKKVKDTLPSKPNGKQGNQRR